MSDITRPFGQHVPVPVPVPVPVAVVVPVPRGIELKRVDGGLCVMASIWP